MVGCPHQPVAHTKPVFGGGMSTPTSWDKGRDTGIWKTLQRLLNFCLCIVPYGASPAVYYYYYYYYYTDDLVLVTESESELKQKLPR